MNRTLFTMVAALLCAIPAQSQTPASDKRLMSDADFRAFLVQVQTMLPKLQGELNGIDLEKQAPQIPYTKGKAITDQRDLGLMEINNIQTYLLRLRDKRTVSGELALYGFMQSLYDICGDIVWEEDFSSLTLTHLENYATGLSSLNGRIGNDVNARVALLEKGTCPS